MNIFSNDSFEPKPVIKEFCFSKGLSVLLPVAMSVLFATCGFASDISSSYENGRVAIGGGGYIENLRFNPLSIDQLYARGDVDGFFKWMPDSISPANGHWVNILDNFGTSQQQMYGCLAFDFDPVSVNTIYAAIGSSFLNSTSSGVYKSVTGGSSWSLILPYPVGANYGGHTYGNSLAVDPNNGQVIYYGTQEYVSNYTLYGGLYVTTNGGTSWSVNVSAPYGVPLDASSNSGFGDGPRTVLCDSRQGTVSVAGQTRTKIVYLAYTSGIGFAGGVYQSTDGGQTFNLIAASPSNPTNIALDGTTGNKIVVSTSDHGIWLYQNGSWTNGVSTGTDSAGGEITGIAVDPFNSNQILGRGNQRIWRSTNGGVSWTAGTTSYTAGSGTDSVLKYNDNVWSYTFQGPGEVAFDPFRQGTVFTGDPFSICRTSNAWAGNAIWYPVIYGLETTSAIWLSSAPAPSNNLLLYGCQDVRGFTVQDLAVYPTQTAPADPNKTGGTYDRCFAVCEQNPTYIVAVKQNAPNGVFTSTDDGKTWTQQVDPPNTESKASGYGLQVAVSATTPDHVVFLDKTEGPYYTTNMFSAGSTPATWTQSNINLGGYYLAGADQYQANITGLVSDKFIADKFYLDAFSGTSGTPDRVYVSTDGGKSFAVPPNQVIPWSNTWAKLFTSPGLGNDIWALPYAGNEGQAGAVYHSTDGGVTWPLVLATANNNVIYGFAVGAPAPGTTTPTIYITGEYNGIWGVFRSNNLGASFDTISNDANIGSVTGARGYGGVLAMEGDRQVYGRVYICSDATGVSYLQPIGSGTGGSSPGTQGNAQISLASTTPAPLGTVNLTTEGTTDWCFWDTVVDGNLTPTDRKASNGTAVNFVQASSYINGAFPGWWNIYPGSVGMPKTWTDGTPIASGSANDAQYTYIPAAGDGYIFNVPADTTARTVKLYVGVGGGAGNAGATLTATLSDNSAPKVISSQLLNGWAAYTITYQANSTAQTLHLQWQLSQADSQWSWLGVQALTVSLATQTQPNISLQPFTDGNIGSPSVAGSASLAGSTYTVSGGGADIWNNSDQFNYLSQSATGDQTVVTEVTSITNTDGSAKAGIMFRDSSANNAVFIDLVTTEGAGIYLQWRQNTSGSCSSTSGYYIGTPTSTNPNWLKLVKSGNTYTGYYSTDGSTWNPVGSATVSLTNTNYLVGLAVTAHNNGLLNTATFTNLSIAVSGSDPDVDIGAPGQKGSVTFKSGAYTVKGGGADIWNTADQFNFDYWSSNETNKTIITEVTSIANTDPWAKAGVMFRDSTAAGAIFVDLVATEGQGVSLQWRSSTGGGCGDVQVSSIATPTSANPVWLKLVKKGTSYTGFYSLNGNTWNSVGSTITVTLTNSTYLNGLAVTAHNNSLLNTATFTDLSLQ